MIDIKPTTTASEGPIDYEEALIAYYAAVIEQSVGVDFYSVLIGPGDDWRPDGNKAADYHSQMERLARYIVSRPFSTKAPTSPSN